MENDQAAKTVVADDVEIVGSINCASNIELNGKLNGDLTCAGQVVVGNTASVKGNISAESVTLLGQVNGNIGARDRIELKSTARLNGDIRAKRLTVEDGVTFVGKSEVNPSGPSRGSGGESKPGATEAEEPAETPEQPAGEDQSKSKSGVFGRK